MARKDRLLLMAERGRFLLTTEADGAEEAWDGVLVDWDEAHFILGDVSQVSPTGDRLKIDGQLWLPRARVKYMQKT